jgi:hypothetical protein
VDVNSLVHDAQASAYGLLVAVVLIAVWAFYAGKIHSDREFSKLEKENEALKTALAAERLRSDEAVRAGSVTNTLIGALRDVATERAAGRREPPGLTAKDIGL